MSKITDKEHYWFSETQGAATLAVMKQHAGDDAGDLVGFSTGVDLISGDVFRYTYWANKPGRRPQIDDVQDAGAYDRRHVVELDFCGKPNTYKLGDRGPVDGELSLEQAGRLQAILDGAGLKMPPIEGFISREATDKYATTTRISSELNT